MSAESLHLASGKNVSERKQVFVVDDDESVCRALRILLVANGFAVNIFPAAEDFFSAVPNGAPGCLILDIFMPRLEGWGALEHLLKSGSRRPVIMMTGQRDAGLKERALKAGVAGFIEKPFRDQELVDLINQVFPK